MILRMEKPKRKIMKSPSRILPLCLLLGFVSTFHLQADPRHELPVTNENTLNDLVRTIPYLSYFREDQLSRLSAIQEQLVVFESRMRGEGLPEPLATAFSINYAAIQQSLVDDRITEEYGRDLLSVHRQLLDRTHLWLRKPAPDKAFFDEVIRNLHFFVSELQENALSRHEVPVSVRTPVVNGYQVWLGELLAWACECKGVSAGAVDRIEVFADELERFERSYKKDGQLRPHEREDLHRRFLKLTRETITTLERLY